MGFDCELAVVATALTGYSFEKYKGLGIRMPLTAIALAIALLALAGVPPFNGFWSKLVIFGVAIDSSPSMVGAISCDSRCIEYAFP